LCVFAGDLAVAAYFLVVMPPSALTLPWIRSFGLVFPVLTGVFITASSFVVTYISVRAYSREGLLRVLLLGCGALVFGCTSLFTSVFVGTGQLDVAAAVFATGSLTSGAFHLACASLTYLRATPIRGKSRSASFWVPVASFSVVAIVAAALEGALPQFYEVGTGTTTLGQVVLGAGACAFASSSAVMFKVYSSSRSGVLFWYSTALAATAIGILGAILADGDFHATAMRVGWGALYFGGLCLFISLVSAERMKDLPAPNGKGP
jgi:hypothetical protein